MSSKADPNFGMSNYADPKFYIPKMLTKFWCPNEADPNFGMPWPNSFRKIIQNIWIIQMKNIFST